MLLLEIAQKVEAETTYLAGIDAAITIAIEHSSELKAAQARLGQAEAKIFTANAPLNPIIISDNGTGEKTYRLGLQYIVETGDKRKKRTNVAKIEHEILYEETNIKILDIKAQVRKTYIELYTAQQREKTLHLIINVINDLLAIAEIKHKMGQIPQLDVIQIEMARIEAEVELQNAHADIIQAHNKLDLLLGNTLDGDCVLETPKLNNKFDGIKTFSKEQHNLNLEKLEEMAYQNRPELKLHDKKIKLAQSQLALAKVNRIPNLLLAAGPDWVFNPNGSLNVGAFIMAAMEIPILDQNKGPIKEAEANEEYARKQHLSEKQTIIYEIKNAYNNITLYTTLIEQYENEILPRADKIVIDSMATFKNSEDDVVVPLIAQETFLKVKMAYFKLLSDYQSSISDLERAIGIPL